MTSSNRENGFVGLAESAGSRGRVRRLPRDFPIKFPAFPEFSFSLMEPAAKVPLGNNGGNRFLAALGGHK
jgi:hypothetical protein